jgi:hypothetical protein
MNFQGFRETVCLHHLKTEAEMVSEIVEVDSMLTWLTTQENFFAFGHCDIFKSFAVMVGCSFLYVY